MKSYGYSDFLDKDAELKRLEKQASVLVSKEKVLWDEVAKSSTRILDAGSGPGFITSHLGNHFRNAKVTGLELNKELHEFSKMYMEKIGLKNTEMIQGDVCKSPFEDNTFDFIYSRFVFSHLPDPKAAFKEFKRILKPGGRFCVLDVDDSWFTAVPQSSFIDDNVSKGKELQRARGGDREIGSKLGYYAEKAGFKTPMLRIELLNNSTMDLQTLLNIFMMGRADYVDDVDRETFISKTNEESKKLIDENGWLSMAIFLCIGAKS